MTIRVMICVRCYMARITREEPHEPEFQEVEVIIPDR